MLPVLLPTRSQMMIFFKYRYSPSVFRTYVSVPLQEGPKFVLSLYS